MQPDLSYYGAYSYALIALLIALACFSFARQSRWLLLFAGLFLFCAVVSFMDHRPDQFAWSPDGSHLAIVRDAHPQSDAGPEIFVRRRGTLRFWHVRTGPVASGGNWHLQWAGDGEVRVNVPNDCSYRLDGIEVRCDGALRETLLKP
jgi:hypothetical protein